MDALKLQLLRIQEQLSGLSASQKMLTASLVAIMVMTIGWWARYAGTAEMEPILDQSFQPAELQQIRLALGSQGIPVTVTADRVMVPANQRYEALAALAFSNALPSNSYAAWDEMLKQSSLWDSSSKTAGLQKHMLERLMSDWMTGFFPGIEKATVAINNVQQRRIGGPPLEPTATVIIKTRGSDFTAKKLVSAAASAVASAVSGLRPPNVSVIINGESHRMPDPSSGFNGEADETVREWEKDKTRKLEWMFPENSRISVSVDVERSKKLEESEEFKKEQSLIVEAQIESKNQESRTPTPAVNDAGAVANTRLDVTTSPEAAAGSKTDENRTTMQVHPGRTAQRIETPAGKATVSSVAIRIPRSYFARKLMRGDSSAKEPDDNAIQAELQAEMEEFKETARTALGMASVADISIGLWYDSDTPMVAALAESGLSTAGIGSMMGKHAREMVVGGLAVVSLFMLMSIVKKGTPVPVLPQAIMPTETPRLGSTEDVAGIVGDSNTTLDAMELDESAVKAQQMVEQVATMVKENPDAAANLVKRWLNRS